VGLMLDTSLVIAFERGKFDLRAFFTSRASESIAVSAVTASELYVGVYRATPDRRDKREQLVNDFLSRIAVVPFDLEIARTHARLSAELSAQGANVGSHDLLIAATALHRGDIVVTRDAKSFPKIPELKTEVL
jgi:tRNA(fMet)-specific endonuclease VapC